MPIELADSDSVALAETLCEAAATVSARRRLAVVRTIAGVEALRPVWSGWKVHPDSDIDVFLALFRCRPDFLEPYVLVLYENEQPEALLAARLIEKNLDLKIGYRRFFRSAVRTLNVPCGGILGNASRENCRLLLAGARRALRSRHADLMLFEALAQESPMFALTQDYPMLFRSSYARMATPHRRLHIAADFNLARLRPRIRDDRKRFANRLKTDFGNNTAVRTFRSPAEVEELIQAAERVARTTYQRALGVGFSADSAQACVLLRLWAERGWLRGHVMYAESTPISFAISTVYAGCVYLDFIGFDKKYERYSPGTLLLMHAIEQYQAEGLKAVDFGIGDARYKSYFSNTEWLEAPVYLFRPSLRAFVLNQTRNAGLFVHETVKGWLQETHLLERTKKALRSHATEKADSSVRTC